MIPPQTSALPALNLDRNLEPVRVVSVHTGWAVRWPLCPVRFDEWIAQQSVGAAILRLGIKRNAGFRHRSASRG